MENRLIWRGLVTLILAAGSAVVIIPLIYMISLSLREPAQIRADPLNLIPYRAITIEVDGRTRPVYEVTIDGVTQDMVLVRNVPRGYGLFAPLDTPDATIELLISEQTPKRILEIHWENYAQALTIVPFNRYLVNTLIVTFVGMAGMLFSCSLVAYGFARFRAPKLNGLFLLLLSTIMLPRQVTLIPIYVIFQRLGWIDTLLPLIVPQFFANAYDVFLLRQFFMTISLEQDEAAKLDGANPLQILLYILLPQSKAAIVTVAIFHFLYAWNDFYEPLIFLHSRDNWTMAVGLQTFNALYTNNTHLIMAASVVMIVPPLLLFFFAQGVFMRGVVISGSKG